MNYEARIDGEGEGVQAAPFNPMIGSDDEDRRAKRRMILIGVVIAALLAAMWLFMHRGGAEKDPAADKAGQAATVSVVVPGRATITGAISASATLAARRELPVGSVGEGGQVAQVLVEAGQWVRQGQVLAVIDRSVQSQQQIGQAAQIQVSEADARLAQANLDRALRLVQRGFVSKADVDRLTATRDAANARVGVARASLGQLRAQAARLNIVAPAAGLLLERKVEPGQVVGAGSGVLFRIAKGGEMEALAQVGEADLAALSVGVAAEVTPVGSTTAYTGQVWQLSPVINPQSRQGTARIALSYAPDLRPGGFASVVIRSGTVVAPLLPESAILSDEKGSYVYVVGPGNKAQRRSVTIGTVNASGIPIVAGLSGQEQVVLRAGGFLAPGETIVPRLVK
ncbi:MAG: efflux RND transporter periplasmic adaptor subunit [Sphingomonadales bacterium]|nr:efflux RND transporter periplasmic adaptor subunit [Sphingomonadales bacterium]